VTGRQDRSLPGEALRHGISGAPPAQQRFGHLRQVDRPTSGWPHAPTIKSPPGWDTATILPSGPGSRSALHGQSRDPDIEHLANLLRQSGRGERLSKKVGIGIHDAKLAESVRWIT